MGRTPALIASIVFAGCSSPSAAPADATALDTSPDGALDASIDGPDYIDFSVTAHYLDWDATAASPCPIVGATWTVRYDPSRVGVTDATGAFTVDLRSYLAVLDVTEPAAPSSCASPASTYTMPAIAIMPPVIHYAGGHFEMRSPTMARVTTLYAAIGADFDASRGQLLVHLDGPSRAVTISSPHANAQAFDGSTWTAGATGVDVFFPNVDLGSNAATTVTVEGTTLGAGSVPLVAGTLTYMTVITN